MRTKHLGWALGTSLLGLVCFDCIHEGANTQPWPSADQSEMHDTNDPTQANFDTRRKEEMGSQYGTTMPGAKTRKPTDDDIGGKPVNTRRDGGTQDDTGWNDDSDRRGEVPSATPNLPPLRTR